MHTRQHLEGCASLVLHHPPQINVAFAGVTEAFAWRGVASERLAIRAPVWPAGGVTQDMSRLHASAGRVTP